MSAVYTLVAFHAHPDDEALLTGGTLARVAAEGHRVVLVVATAGEAGLASARLTSGNGGDLGGRRRREVEASARLLGVAEVVHLGYADSGYPDPRDRPTSRAAGAFADVPPIEVARELAEILVRERADVLTTYDVHGGYGHPDHVQVHRVGRLAAELAGTPVVLEATVDRDLLLRAVGTLRGLSRVLGRVVGGLLRLPTIPDLGDAFTARADITHRVDVRPYVHAKRRALAAHASQATGGPRTVAILLWIPRPLANLTLGREWFREVGRNAHGRPVDDVFDTVRRRAGRPV